MKWSRMKKITGKIPKEITLASLKRRTGELIKNKSDSGKARFRIVLIISLLSTLTVIFFLP